MTDRARHGRTAGLIFMLVWLSMAWFGSWEWNPNTAVRMFAALSIVEDGSATIDRYAGLTIDKARFGDHYYSDKAPGMTLMALPATAAIGAVTGVHARDVSLSMYDLSSGEFLKLRVWAAAASTAAPLTAIAAVAVFALALALGASSGGAVFAGLAFALGTPMWGWSTTLFGHAPVAALFAVAIWAAWSGTQSRRPALAHAALVGAALGWAVVVEFPAIITGFPIGVFWLWRIGRHAPQDRYRALLAAGLPAMVAAAVLLGYNLFAFGTPFQLGYQGVVGFEGMNQGLFGLTYPKPGVLWEISFGPRRGLLWVAPISVVGLIGLARLTCARGTRAIGLMALTGVVITLLYNAAYAYWDGGNSTGPRHLVPALAYLAVGFAPAWGWLASIAWRSALALLLLVSAAVNLVIAAAEIATGGQGAFPLWSDVFSRFANGELRTLPSAWFGWSPFGGLALYLLVAGGVLAMLVPAMRSPR